MSLNRDREQRLREIGSGIHSAAARETPSFFDTGGWMGRIMEWAMRDEAFKFQLFRYVDVLPSLKRDALVVELLKEYFTGEVNTPPLIRKGIERLGKGALGSHIAAKVIRAGVQALARQFIAGKDPRDALGALKTLREKGCAVSVDLLGEVVVSEREAEEYGEGYLELLKFMSPEAKAWKADPLLDRDERGAIPRFDISFKVSSLYSRLDPMDWEGSVEQTKERLRPLLRMAKEADASICFDMEHSYYKDLTLAVFKSILEEFSDFPFAGVALQAYLKDTRGDLLDLLDWARARKRRITVRLVKGAYWDYETAINRQKGWPVPVFQNKEETDLNFEELTALLLENSEFFRPAIATHNIRSVSNAIAVAESLDLPPGSFEFQMLYGMGEPVRRVLRKMGHRVRVYAAVGELIPGMAYLVRRLLENTSNESFVRQFFAEKRSFEELIRPPQRTTPGSGHAPSGKAFRNEPPLDFSEAGNREKMKDALKRVRGELNRRYPLAGGNGEAMAGVEAVSVNPANPSEVVGRVSLAGTKEAERAIQPAREAWATWRAVSPRGRAEYLFRAAEELRKKRFELAALEVYEVGKTWKDADGDVTEAIDYLEYYGREMEKLGAPVRLGDYSGEVNDYGYEPRGIGVVIAPWNFPLAIPAGMVSAGIVAGNCVIFKPSGLSPVTGWKLAEAFRSTGLPPGVLQFLPGRGGEAGEFLVSHPATDFIAFTGSREVGLEIVKRAGETSAGQRNVKKVIAEMGGKNAVIVDETADMDEAVAGVLESALGFQGQKCSACSRVIVIGEAWDEFCDRLWGAMESITIGPPENPGVLMGPVIDDGARKRIQGYRETAVKAGKVVRARDAKGEGFFVGPAMVLDAEPDSPLAQDEIFGPLVAVMRAGDFGEAMEIANSTPYALTGGIFSRSPAHIMRAKDEFRVGNLYINRKITGALVGRQPFGGFGMSGVGSKAGGPDYLLQFMNPRTISENVLRRGFSAPVVPGAREGLQ